MVRVGQKEGRLDAVEGKRREMRHEGNRHMGNEEG